MKNTLAVRQPADNERYALLQYVIEQVAFDPLDPSPEESKRAEKKVAQARIAVFPAYRQRTVLYAFEKYQDRLLVVIWDDEPEHHQVFLCDKKGVYFREIPQTEDKDFLLR